MFGSGSGGWLRLLGLRRVRERARSYQALIGELLDERLATRQESEFTVAMLGSRFFGGRRAELRTRTHLT